MLRVLTATAVAAAMTAGLSACAVEADLLGAGALPEQAGEGDAVSTQNIAEAEVWINPDELTGEEQAAPPEAGPIFAPRARAAAVAARKEAEAAAEAEALKAAEAAAAKEAEESKSLFERLFDAEQAAIDEAAAARADEAAAVEEAAKPAETVETEAVQVAAAGGAVPSAGAADKAPPQVSLDPGPPQSAPPELGPSRGPSAKPPKQPSYIPASLDLAKMRVSLGRGEGEKLFPNPKKCNAVYLHDDGREKPVEAVPEDRRAFAGHWVSGKWDGNLCQELVVEEVREDGTARIADLRGRYTPWKAEPLAIRREAAFTDDGSLIVPMTGGEMTFWLSDGRMYGVFQSGGRTFLATFTRKR